MCGICGVYRIRNNSEFDSDLIHRMTSVIMHRGPDDEGFYIDRKAGIGLGHRRLSIIDLETGRQPMSNASRDIWIVFNGEIYNFPALKQNLIKKDYHFRTTSDTEVIINLYQEYGEKAFTKLNGIFAFAIYDERKKCLILVRDYFGVKPLYYTINNGRLLFGSEIKVILQDSSIKRELDLEAFNSYLTFRYNPSPQTLIKNIKKLKPGHYLKVSSTANVELKPFLIYTPQTNPNITEKEAIEEYQRFLENAVKRQMISDVPVGLLLSGGIDSAVIGYLMNLTNNERIKTFTIGIEGKGDYNELADAKKTAYYIGSDHYDLCISRDEYLEFFLNSFHYTEEPIAETSIPSLYYVSKLASQHLKVVMSGQGADEPLAGYHRYIGEYYISKYAPILKLLPLETIAGILPRNERFKRAVFASQFSSELQRFLGIYTIFTPTQKKLLLNGRMKKEFFNIDQAMVERLYDQTNELRDSLAKILFIDARMHLPDDLLIFGDKVTMANSLEMRVPFLDIDLMRFLESLPSSFKIKGGTRKYIHKKAIGKWLPREIIYRKKRGFTTPIDEWLQDDLAITVKQLFNGKDSACREYLNLKEINKMIEQHQLRKENYQRQIFTLLSFELWYQIFLCNNIIDKKILSFKH